MGKKKLKNALQPSGITISFDREEISWLHWVVADVMDIPGGSPDTPAGRATSKVIDAEKLLQKIEKVIHERTKVRKVDSRKRAATGPRRKSARGRSKQR